MAGEEDPSTKQTLIVALSVAVMASLAATLGADWIVQGTGVTLNFSARLCVAVAGASAVGAVAAVVNAVRIKRTGESLRLGLAKGWDPWLQAIAAIAVGALIGTTIFV